MYAWYKTHFAAGDFFPLFFFSRRRVGQRFLGAGRGRHRFITIYTMYLYIYVYTSIRRKSKSSVLLVYARPKCRHCNLLHRLRRRRRIVVL